MKIVVALAQTPIRKHDAATNLATTEASYRIREDLKRRVQ
jgi:hypothetical protein